MTEQNKSPYRPRVVSQGDIPAHKGAGLAACTTVVSIPRPMPGIVILIHGVNDVGEAYQNQEKGIIAGLSKRLNRDDMYPHGWNHFQISDAGENCAKICKPGRSPVIPFYWGYKPVTYADWKTDQQRYRDEVGKLSGDARLPYDAYQEFDPEKKAAAGNDGKGPFKFQNDNFANALDENYAKGGGVFANATTCIPDMLGPGSAGLSYDLVAKMSRNPSDGDYTHAMYSNPHRIYQFFAAQRLADLILQIRREPVTKDDVINIVAHSQGTIITMLANMLVKKEGVDPVNCVILNHSPYSLESRILEDASPGYQQDEDARVQTFKNFCALMQTMYKGDYFSDAELLAMESTITLRKPSDNPLRKDEKFRRNNSGKVYNYFCPQDGTVSLLPVQGFGWRGIPHAIADGIPNLRQRVFCQHHKVGVKETEMFKMPPEQENDFSYSIAKNAAYKFNDIRINGEELPEPFDFELQGQGNHKDNDPKTSDKPYTAYIDPDSPDAYISYSAKAYALKRTESATYSVNSYQSIGWFPGHVLSKEELAVESISHKKTMIHGIVTGTRDFQNLRLTWMKSEEDLRKEWQRTDPVGYSQHSSIVMSKYAPSHAIAYDLAIGQCKAFDYRAGKFWEDLLHRADWRDHQNKNPQAREYFLTGRLNAALTKDFMNKPDGALPVGKYGVVNSFKGGKKVIPSRDLAAGNQEVSILQWDMPEPKSDSELI
ncbi:T6SS effector phospholipase Tle3 domain-containing protein [Enterobacter oligotrophicus]|uniref:T6SS effector phospholipase Tle3 domain-containing protein n=1 Tax=Enterobacter oligotrophicus TaxID=2478464 RepID=UPI0012608B89|nr:DUF3274 domain-containing protein [Enterobacter oligotrophicus]